MTLGVPRHDSGNPPGATLIAGWFLVIAPSPAHLYPPGGGSFVQRGGGGGWLRQRLCGAEGRRFFARFEVTGTSKVETKRGNLSPRCEPWCWKIYLYIYLKNHPVNVGK